MQLRFRLKLGTVICRRPGIFRWPRKLLQISLSVKNKNRALKGLKSGPLGMKSGILGMKTPPSVPEWVAIKLGYQSVAHVEIY